MTDTQQQTLTGSHDIDGQSYVNIDFKDATLNYAGGQPPVFQNCHFGGATFNFTGAAGATVQFLNAMAPASTNMREVVLGLIPGLRD